MTMETEGIIKGTPESDDDYGRGRQWNVSKWTVLFGHGGRAGAKLMKKTGNKKWPINAKYVCQCFDNNWLNTIWLAQIVLYSLSDIIL